MKKLWSSVVARRELVAIAGIAFALFLVRPRTRYVILHFVDQARWSRTLKAVT